MNTPRFKATYQGQVIGWYDTAEEADKAIEQAKEADRKSDEDFDREYNPNLKCSK